MATMIRLDAVTRRFGSTPAVDAVSLEIADGEFFALLGPSGCGKTTLMRLIAGLEPLDAGDIFIDGRSLKGVAPYRRPVNMMFQSYALFPHMSVAGNIAFGLQQMRLPRAEIASRVANLLHLVQLDGLGARRPDQLSGGQRQRVALARALARQPRLLLLDEPLAALDRKLREDTQLELMRLQREVGASFMLVTHDQDEAMTMATRIAVMRAGRIEQIGSPREIYESPANRFVAGFIGRINLLDATVEASDPQTRLLHCRTVTGVRVEAMTNELLAAGTRVCLAIRPEALLLQRQQPEALRLQRQPEAGVAAFEGIVEAAAFRGEASLVGVSLNGGGALRVWLAAPEAMSLGLSRGDAVMATCAPASVRVLTS